MPISPVPELVAELAAGRMVILVDEADRENEGDLVLASEHVTPEAINFMVTHARGLVCLTLTRPHCERLGLQPMSARNGTRYGTAFTSSIEAAEGVTTGISAADRAHTIRTAIHGSASDIVQPGHVFPIQAVEGGVLMRAGHTEAGCDLAGMAGLAPSSVICEIMNPDGSMARLPELERFAAAHGLKIGTIADLITHRSRHETLVQRTGGRTLTTAQGAFDAHLFRDRFGGAHLALTVGQWQAGDDVLVRVHEPLSALDALQADGDAHSWPLPRALAALQQHGRGAVVLLNCASESPDAFAQRLLPDAAQAPAPRALRTYGLGAQILRALGVGRMTLLGANRPMPSMAGYGLEVTGFQTLP